ncbi:alpha/beta fold hydrolase [Archangium violaceum]|uniref:type I polyketide synthase n=1 Tax=Archangium violaceum TaxID=83451 RepID=UPI001950D156|nr:type I polyketide synthase [Archangium violaceum]QRO00045.1 alpha/beta fold hydrolase [Archangium violaceum]
MTNKLTHPRLPALTEDDLRTLIASLLAERLRIEPRSIDVRERFNRYGLDSQGATGMLADLAQALGRPLSPVLVWQHPTPKALARHLAGGASDLEAFVPGRAERAERSPTQNEPIAIVGMACRFPGAPDLDSYWRLLESGVDAITEVPPDRWDTDVLYDPDPLAPGKVGTRWGGFIEGIDRFDPTFFGISPREATEMDPQQRLMLELSWEALEDAGVPPRSLKDSRTGVFFGAMWQDYARLSGSSLARLTQHSATGQDLSIIPARVSYTLGLRGPSVAINTACSSALVAVHYARQSLLLGEATLALAGGVSLMSGPESMVAMAKLGALAPDGRSKAFDARANGYGRGEGGGVVVLKLLSRALSDGDRIDGLVLGSAINNDGFSNGLTAPSPAAQELVLRDAYANAGVDPRDVQYVEAHGTGTVLGDPIEASALGAVLGAGRPADRPLLLGSVKTNIGHLETAAGIAGLIKTALALKNRTVPPNLHFEIPNPYIAFDALHLKIPTSREPWPERDGRALSGVSSFGFGGTNCHVVLEGARLESACLVPLASMDGERLRQLAARVRDLCLDGSRPLSLPELCAAAAPHAGEGDQRIAVTARTRDDLAARLDGLLQDRPLPGAVAGIARRGRLGPVFVFGGQGSQWRRMGADLLREPAFRASIERCDRVMRPHLGGSLLDALLSGDATWLEDIAWVQPAIFAVQVSLAALWRSWGVEPAAVVGQSMGEIAAATVAGCMSLEDAARIICVWSRLQKRTAGRGTMALVELSLKEARRTLLEREDKVSVAGSMSPSSVVISGDPATIDELLSELGRSGVYARRINVDVAAHCPQMDPLLPELRSALEGIRPRCAPVPFYSTVTGHRLEGSELDADYWCNNLREPVLFAETIERLTGSGHDVFLDVNPHPVLARAVEQCLAHAGSDRSPIVQPGLALPSMRREEPGRAVLLDSLGILYTRGQQVAWRQLYPAERPSGAAFPELWPSSEDGPTPGSSEQAARTEVPAALPLLVSGKTEAALRAQAERLRAHLEAHPDLGLADVACSLALTRTHFERRAVVVAKGRAALLEALGAIAQGSSAVNVVLDEAKAQGKLALLFTGQGSQHPGMGRALYDAFPIFRDALDIVCGHLDAQLERPLRPILFATEGSEDAALLHQTAFTQTALFALEVALFRLTESWGVKPDLLLGHSIGELVAAHVAGVLSLEDACTLVVARARLMQALPQGGAMVSLQASAAEVAPLLVGREAHVAIAALNGPLSTVVAGDEEAVIEVTRQVKALGRKTTRLRISHAPHSPRMDGMLNAFRHVVEGLTFHPPRIPIVSNITGKRASAEELGSPETWVHHVRHAVRFLEGVRTLEAEGVTTFLELGPHGVLCAMAHDCLSDEAQARALFLPALRNDRPEVETLTAALGGLHARGHELDWKAFFAPFGARRIELPTYAFQRERYWLDAPKAGSADVASAGLVSAEHPLLGAAVPFADADGLLFTGRLSLQSHPWLAGHGVFDTVLLPGTAFVELALVAAHRVGLDRIEELTLESPLVLPSKGAVHLQLSVGIPDEAFRRSVTLHARPENAPPNTPWTRHATGTLGATTESASFDLRAWPPAGATPLDLNGLYDRLAEAGLAYGHDFQGLCAAWKQGNDLFAEVHLSEEAAQQADHFGLHPALLDAALHALALDSLLLDAGELALPSAWVGVSLRATGASCLRVRLSRRNGEGTVSLAIADALGEPVASVDALRATPASKERLRSALASRPEPLYRTNQVTLPKASNPLLVRSRALTASHEEQNLDDPATVERLIRGIFRQVTLRDDAGIDSDRSLQSVGVDSLMYLQMLRRAEQTFGVTMSAQMALRPDASRQTLTLSTLTNLLLGIRQATLTRPSPDEVDDGAAASRKAEEEEPALSVERVERDVNITPVPGASVGSGTPLEAFMVTLSSGEIIDVLCAGTGAPLVLLPPIMASIPIWVFQIEELRRDFRVIVPNHPGYGRSTAPHGSLSPARIARRVAAVLDGLGVHEAVHIVGWSLGGMVAQEFSLALPHRVRSLALVNTTSRLEEEDSVRNMEDMMRRLLADLRRTTPEEAPSTLARRTMALEASQRDAGYERSFDYLAEVLRFDAADRIAGIKAPTLVVQGREDTLAVPRYGRHMEREIPRAQYHEFEHGGHYVPLHLPGAFNELLRSFLRRWSV